MEHLLAYIEGHLDELAADLVVSLHEGDPAFRANDLERLRAAVGGALAAFVAYARARDPEHLEAAHDLLAALWPGAPLPLASAIRLLFGFEDLVAIRSQAVFPVDEDFVDTLRVLRAAVREALCALADRVQSARPVVGEPTVPGTPDDPGGRTVPAAPIAPPADDVAVIEAAPPSASGGGLGSGVFVGRTAQLERLWERLRVAAGSGADRPHEVIGIKAPDGYGKTVLLGAFAEGVAAHLGRPPVVLRARAPRLFGVPLWTTASLLRSWLELAPGALPDAADVRGRLAMLAATAQPESPALAAILRDAAPHLLGLLGDPLAMGEVARLDGRTARARLRRSLVALFEALARRAFRETRAPLFLEIEDAGEMDAPSWALLGDLLRSVPPAARLFVLLTYGGRFFVPAPVARYPGFSELTLEQFDMNEGDALIDAVLHPNRLDEATRFRLNAGARGAPLLLFEATRHLVEIGVVGRVGGTWVEVAPLPEERVIQDLAAVVAHRTAALDASAREVLEMVAVVEDAVGGPVLEELGARRALDRDDLVTALERLAAAGLVEFAATDAGIEARVCHPLLRDEVYRAMGPDRRRAFHEDAGEVYERLPAAAAFPSLAADHLALARLPARAVHGLLAGVDRCLALHELVGALELCDQALDLLDGVATPERDALRFRVLWRRERVLGQLGRTEDQAADLERLEALADAAGVGDQERALLAQRLARHALMAGEPARVEQHLVGAAIRPVRGTPAWARARLMLGLAAWQQGHREEARLLLGEAADAAPEGEGREARLRARLRHARGMLDAREGRMAEALRELFEAWRLHRRLGDVYGEALVMEHLAGWYWAAGRLVDGMRVLRRSVERLSETGETRALARARLALADMHAAVGDLDEAARLYAAVLREVDRERDRLVHAAATIGRGRVLVHRGRFDEAMGILAQCLKDLGRRPPRHPLYVDALNALALNFATFARGEKLIVGGLRYAGEAADRATDIGHLRGLVQALTIQVRGLLALNRAPEADARMADLDAALASAVAADPRLARLRAEVELLRHRVRTALGDPDGADRARRAAWEELRAQLRCLEGTGYERGFLTQLLPHREIVDVVGPEALA